MSLNGLAAAVICSVAFAQLVTAQTPTLENVLARMSDYVADYETRLSPVVAEEHYEQFIELPRQSSGATTGRGRIISSDAPGIGPTRRTLVSDFLMIRLPGNADWLGFRDVLTVDGTPVRDRKQRLVQLFTSNSGDAIDQARAISSESARFNIGVLRTINAPTQVLDFLHARERPRVSFRKAGEDTLDGKRVWRVAYQERKEPYLIQTPTGEGMRSSGIAWIDPVEGTVVQTQLNLSTVDAETRSLMRIEIVVSYRQDEALGLRVPAEMRETYEQSDPTSRMGFTARISGHARYQNFRRFETSVKIVGTGR